jgi:hypothetical protein
MQRFDFPRSLVTGLRQALRLRLAAVAASRTLRGYGASLALVHCLTFAYWTRGGFLSRIIAERAPVCWPFLPHCGDFRTNSVALIEWVMGGYVVLAVATACAFLRPRFASLAYFGLLALNVVKLALFFQDYRLTGNYHYMPFILSFAYLFWPSPRRALPYLIVALYVSAGALKVNPEWLSGAALIAKTYLSGRLLEIACAYVVLLELVLVFGLLARRPSIRWAVLVQLVLFHAYSWHVVGFFYPLVMACLLSFFPLAWHEERGDSRSAERSKFEDFLSGRAGFASYGATALYALAQLAPSFFPGDSAVTGEGRMFAINMMDARVSCDHFETVRDGDTIVETSELHPRAGLRIRCDPIRFWNKAKNECRAGDDIQVDTYLVAKRETDSAYRPVFAVEDFCDEMPEFSVLSHNRWIQP